MGSKRAEVHQWEIAGRQAYPIPVVLPMESIVQRPGPRELGWLEAVLRAIPPFAHDHLRAPGGGLRPAEATLAVPVSAGEAQVHLHFPALPGFPSRRSTVKHKGRR